MTLRERILSVYRGETPDVVPFMLDLSHWFYHRHKMPWDLSEVYEEPERKLIDYHRRMGVGFYVANLAHTLDVAYADDTRVSTLKSSHGRALTWRVETPLGAIERERVWEDATYAWGISRWGIETEADLRVLGHALGGRSFTYLDDKFLAWDECVGDTGVVYGSLGYSAMGQLLNLWMGVERTTFATVDWPDTMREVVDQINASNLACVDALAASPADVVIMGDNFSSDTQPPWFFDRWSRRYYEEAIRRLHEAGKCVAVHVDGMLRGALDMIGRTGADCVDAVTPPPLGDLTPAECRQEAGPDLILSGGVSPDLWLPSADLEAFKRAVLDWLDLKRESPRLIANAGDQVPPGADEGRIALMRNLVEERGRY